jgi:dUTPase
MDIGEAHISITDEEISQIVFVPYFEAHFEHVGCLDDTKRGNGGFGSTGD